MISSKHVFGDSVILDRFAQKGSQIALFFYSLKGNPPLGREIEAFGRVVVIYTLELTDSTHDIRPKTVQIVSETLLAKTVGHGRLS